MVDDSVNATVVRATDSFRTLFCSPVTHRDKHIEHGLFEEIWVLLAQSLQEFCGHFRMQARDTAFDLFEWVRADVGLPSRRIGFLFKCAGSILRNIGAIRGNAFKIFSSRPAG